MDCGWLSGASSGQAGGGEFLDLRVGVRLGQAEFGRGGGAIALAKKGRGEVQMGLSEIGTEAEGLAEMCDCFRCVA